MLRDFLRGSELQRHIQIHQKENIATCEFCGFAYGTIHDLNGHINKVHPEKKSQIKKKISKCEFCTREFVSGRGSGNHIQIHQKENNVTCEFCGFVYSNKSDLFVENHTHVYRSCCPPTIFLKRGHEKKNFFFRDHFYLVKM